MHFYDKIPFHWFTFYKNWMYTWDFLYRLKKCSINGFKKVQKHMWCIESFESGATKVVFCPVTVRS